MHPNRAQLRVWRSTGEEDFACTPTEHGRAIARYKTGHARPAANTVNQHAEYTPVMSANGFTVFFFQRSRMRLRIAKNAGHLNPTCPDSVARKKI